MAAAFKLGSHLRELRIQLCQKSKESEGVREFVKKHYVLLKKHNIRFPILIRECSGVSPVLFARYAFGQEPSTSLANLSGDQVLKKISDLSQSSNK